jgi:hypothetical protein
MERSKMLLTILRDQTPGRARGPARSHQHAGAPLAHIALRCDQPNLGSIVTPRTPLLEAWQFTRGIDVHSARRVAAERGARGDVRIAILTTGAGWIRAEAVGGAPRPGAVLFLPDRGLFDVTRCDVWTSAKDAPKRVLVLLRAIADADLRSLTSFSDRCGSDSA